MRETFANGRLATALAVWLSITLGALPAAHASGTVALPEGTTVYLETTKTIVGKKHRTDVGDYVPARVWRDVFVNGQLVIAGGTPASAQVADIKSRGIFGIKGKLAIAAIETRSVDGQQVHLSGGYRKAGKGRFGVSVGVGVFLFWPALLLTGDAARLPSGTVMDSTTIGTTLVSVPTVQPQQSLAAAAPEPSGPALDVDVLYDRLETDRRPKYFEFLLTTDVRAPEDFVIDRINGVDVDPIPLDVGSSDLHAEQRLKSVYARVEIGVLMPGFKQGFNTFEVAYDDRGRRVADEVLLEIEL